MTPATRFVVVICMLPALATGTAARGSETTQCRQVDADFRSELAAEGCASPLGLCAAGTIRHDPLLKGSMFVTINDAAPWAGMPASEAASTLSVSGERSLKPRRGGSLTAHVVGVFDTALGIFEELNIITSGTEHFAGATGTLHVFGRATGPTTFTGEIHGVICLP